MIGQDNSERNNTKGRGSIRATNRFWVSRQSQTSDIAPLTSAVLIATKLFESALSCSKQTAGTFSNRDKTRVFPLGVGRQRSPRVSNFALATTQQPLVTALIADPRLEIELSHLQYATSKILIGSKQGGRPRKSEEKEKKREAGETPALRSQRTKTANREIGAPRKGGALVTDHQSLITAFLLYSPVFWDRIEPWA